MAAQRATFPEPLAIDILEEVDQAIAEISIKKFEGLLSGGRKTAIEEE